MGYAVSIWNRIGDVASTFAKTTLKAGEATGKGLFNFGEDIVKSSTAIPRMAWDIGTAPWNDAKDYNGFIQPFKTALEKNGKDLIKPLADAGGAIMKVPGVQPALERINYINQNYIREPLATFALVQGDVAAGRASFFDPNEWKKAFTGAQDISLGQALVSQYRSYYDPKFNVYDPRQRDQAFKQSAWGKWITGSVDTVAQIFGDVTIVGGKATKALKASELVSGYLKSADVIAKAAEDVTKAQYGVNNRFTKVLDDFTKNDSIYALNHPMVKSSDQPALLAHLLGESKDKDTTALILRSAMADPHAMDELAILRADMKDALTAARGDLSAVDEYKLFSAPDGTGMIPFLNDNPAVIADAEANYAALAKADESFAKMMGLGEGGGALTRTTGKLGQGVEDFIANARSMRFYDKNVGTPNIEVFQPTPFHRLYQKISWAQNERPAGLLDFNDPDSYREVVATLERLRPTNAIKGTPSALKRMGVVSDEQANKLLDNYIKAATPEQRQIAALNIESTGLRSLAAKYNIDEQTADEIYNTYKGARQSGLRSIKDKGFMVDLDGSMLKVPQLESQSADYLPMMDFELMNRLLKENGSAIRTVAGAVTNPVIHYADILQDAFKAGALIRLGYTIRNGIDSQLRIAASVGALTTMRHLGPGFKNIINNTNRVPTRLVDRYLPIHDGMTIKNVQQSATGVIRELDTLKTQIAELEAKASLNPNNLDVAGELNTKKLLQEEKMAVYSHYTETINRVKTKAPKDRIGTGSYEVTTSDGQKYILPDAFGGPLGEMFRRIASSQNSFQRMAESNSEMYARKLQTKGFGQIRPTDPGYFEQWAQTLRQQFGNAAVPKKLAAGENPEDITRWLIGSPEGRDLRRRLDIPSKEAAEYVTKIKGFFDNYLPASSGLRNKLRDVTAEDLRAAFPDPTSLPTVHGHVLEEALTNTGRLKGREIINGVFHFLATLPEDTWARNPLYVQLYRKEAERRINIVAEQQGARISTQAQEAIMAASHKIAMREMKNILFNIERRTNLATAMKYISPFFSAQENAYKTWLKLAAANPAIVNRGYNVWQSPNRSSLVTDQDGNVVPEGQTSGSDVIWMSVPKGLTKLPFIGKGLEPFTKPDRKPGDTAIYSGGFGIPKQSLDIIFQGGMDVLYNKGNPNVFSDIFPVGPYVAVPIGELVKKKPTVADAFRWALPYGASKNIPAGFLPAWVNKAQVATSQLDDEQFAKSYDLIFATEQTRAKRNGEPPVDPNKIMKMTQDYWKMRIAANLIMPFAPRFDTPYKFYMDKSREYKRKYALEADSKFLNDYPDFFAFTASTSKNPAKVDYTVAAVKNLEKYGPLVTQLAQIEPKLIGALVNEKDSYKFSQAAYQYLYNKNIAPNSKEKFLSAQDPIVAQKANEAEKGWIVYGQFRKAINDELESRGLTSITQKGAEDLAIVKQAIIQKLSIATDASGKPIINKNTGTFQQTPWYDDYLDSDGSKTNRVVNGISKILDHFEKTNDSKGDNPTWKSMGIYFDFRKAIASELMTRPVHSIDAKANQDLKIVYDGMVKKLSHDDPLGFGPLYERFLSQDLVADKYLTPREIK
jgi:hypothetical protein